MRAERLSAASTSSSCIKLSCTRPMASSMSSSVQSLRRKRSHASGGRFRLMPVASSSRAAATSPQRSAKRPMERSLIDDGGRRRRRAVDSGYLDSLQSKGPHGRTSLGAASAQGDIMIPVGETAPDFEVLDHTNKKRKLSDFKGK